jgi:hypothetical protein
MRRVMAAVAATGAATLAAAAVMVPAFAATRPGDHAARTAHAAHTRVVAHLKADRPAKPTLADVITSEFGDGGKYVTVVSCSGKVTVPPPVLLARLDDPLTVHGGHPTPTIEKLLSQPKTYKTIYTCTVVVKVKTPTPKKKSRAVTRPRCELGPGGGVGGPWHMCHRVILNTGFGGRAGAVAKHHPRG